MSGNNQFDAVYDLFFSPSNNPNTPSAELMVWLNYSGTQPAGTKVASGVTLGIEGGTWDVWSGNVGWPVWSFVADQQTTSYSGDLQPFIYYVSYTNNWLNQSWYELNTEFGAEILNSNGANGGQQMDLTIVVCRFRIARERATTDRIESGNARGRGSLTSGSLGNRGSWRSSNVGYQTSANSADNANPGGGGRGFTV